MVIFDGHLLDCNVENRCLNYSLLLLRSILFKIIRQVIELKTIFNEGC